MSDSFYQYGRRVISGEARGVRAALLRGAMGGAAPFYSLAMRARNLKFDRGMGVRRLGRPVVSVGNVTAGGTGKTPVVRWLCERLRESGRHPAVLMRGYKARPGERGDEQAMLEALLNRDGVEPVVVHARPSRYDGGLEVLAANPAVDVLVMDDGFQHRRLARDFDLVLIDACEPFGFGRTFPRGLLREPLAGLARASAILITRADQGRDVEGIVQTVRRFNATAPVYRCAHAHAGLRSSDGILRPVDHLAGTRFFAFAGIGNPQGFARQLEQMPGTLAGARWFGDHWDYTRGDLDAVAGAARQAGAQALVTTDKDWVKVSRVAGGAAGMPVWRIDLAVQFFDDDEARLLGQIRANLGIAPHTA